MDDQAVEDPGLGAGGDAEAVRIGLSMEEGEALLDFCRLLGASGRRDISPVCWVIGETSSRGLDDVGLEGNAVRMVAESRRCPEGDLC